MSGLSDVLRLRLDPELREAFAQRAAAEHVPVSLLVRRAMRLYLQTTVAGPAGMVEARRRSYRKARP